MNGRHIGKGSTQKPGGKNNGSTKGSGKPPIRKGQG